MQLFLEYKNKHKQHTFIYTDGSRNNSHTGAGLHSENLQLSFRLPDIYSIFSAEVFGILLATKYIQREKIKKSIICTDSRAALTALLSFKASPHPFILNIQNIINQIRNTSEVIFLWIPGHAGIQGNEAADKLAKNGLQLPLRKDYPSPIQDIFNHLHSKLQELRQFDWNNNPHYYLYPIKPIVKHFNTSQQDSRIKERTLARLRIGHTQATHLHIIQRLPPPTCEHCRNERLTIKHFLIDCLHFQQHRQPIIHYIRQNNLDLDLPTLLGDDHPDLIKLLFQYLTNTHLMEQI